MRLLAIIRSRCTRNRPMTAGESALVLLTAHSSGWSRITVPLVALRNPPVIKCIAI